MLVGEPLLIKWAYREKCARPPARRQTSFLGRDSRDHGVCGEVGNVGLVLPVLVDDEWKLPLGEVLV